MTRSPPLPDRRPLYLREQAAGFGICVLVLGLTGPFRTYDMQVPLRFAYWAATTAAGWALVLGLLVLLQRLPRTAAWPPLRRSLAAVTLAVLPAALLVWQIDGLMRPDAIGGAPWLVLVNAGGMVVLIGGLVVALMRSRLIPAGPVPERCAFLDRLPPQIGTALISITAQDHYLEVVTAKGRTMLHLRFSDALKELGPYPGQQIHRSHWIAAHAFTGTTRARGKLVAHLADGRVLPVSRSHAATVLRMQPVRPPPDPCPIPVKASRL